MKPKAEQGPSREIEQIYALTPLQQGMLFHSLESVDEGQYIEQFACTLEGDFQERAFVSAWEQLVGRHAILRTSFVWKGQRDPVQVVMKDVAVPFESHDWGGLPEREQELRWRELLIEDRSRGFELRKAPLMRLIFVSLANGKWKFLWTHHHLLLDGWSLPILLREFLQLLESSRRGAVCELAPARAFSGYIAWLQQHDLAEAESFWRHRLAEFTEPSQIAESMAKPPHPARGEARSSRADISVDETLRLTEFSKNTGVTLNAVVQAAWAIVLSRYTNRNDVAFGVTLSGRPADLPGSEEMVGLFINTLPLRVDTSGEQLVCDWLREVGDRQLRISEFEHSPLGKISAWSELGSGTPLFDHILVFENYPTGEELAREIDDLKFCEIEFHEHTNYPLTLIGVPGEELSLRATWMPETFTEEGIDLLLSHWKQVLGSIARSRPDLTVAKIQMLTKEELFQYFDWAQATPLAEPASEKVKYMPDLVCEWAVANPETTALTVGDENLSYGEFERRSAVLANRLLQSGVTAGDHVGILVERNFDLIVSMLAVLRAGCVYVPIDSESPAERVRFILKDASVACCLISADLPKPDIECGWIDPHVLDGDEIAVVPELNLSADAPAYMIYTSGSTGEPKGCLISHKNLLRLFTQTNHWFDFSSSDVWTVFHSAAFDFSVWEIWGALLFGGRLVVVPREICRDPREFAAVLANEKVTVLNQTPSAFLQLIELDSESELELPELRVVVFGGEKLKLESLSPWIARHGDTSPELINMYGITETTVHVTYQRITEGVIAAGQGSVIGEPIPDLCIYLLDCHGNPAPVGIDAEMFVSGAGVSLGYWERESLTAERFPLNAFGEGKLYRTGDLARRRENGALEFRGRIDHQVKIRGFRVELGEVEHSLLHHAEIREAVVQPRENPATGDLWLVAWYVGDAELSDDVLRGFLESILPGYMIPALFIKIDAFKLTQNGKRNLSALPEAAASGPAEQAVAARDELEAGLVAIWQTVLGCGDIGIDDNYYSLGGDSIRSIRIVSDAAEQGIHFGIRDLLENPTIAGVAQVIRDRSSEVSAEEAVDVKELDLVADEDRNRLPDGVEDAWPLAQLQSGMVFHQSYEEAGASTYHDIFSFVIEGQWEEHSFRSALEELMARHSVLRSSIDFAEYSVPLQLVRNCCEPPLEVVDLAAENSAVAEQRFAEWFATEKGRTFQIDQAPLFRVTAHLLAGDKFQLSICFHHAILDGWSFGSLVRELLQRWKAETPVELDPPLSYKRFIELEQQALQNRESAAYWEKVMQDAPFAGLPRLRSSRDGRGGRELVDLAEATSDRLKSIAVEWGVPLKHVLLAIHLRVLATFCRQEDLVVGLVSNGRPDEPGGDETLGLFLNTLPFRCKLSPGWSWSELVDVIAVRDRQMFSHRRFPLAEIQNRCGGEALFETDFNFVHFHVLEKALEDERFNYIGGDSHEETNFALTADFSVSPTDGRITGSLSFDRDILDPNMVVALAESWNLAAEAFCQNPSARIGEVALSELPIGEAMISAEPAFEPVQNVFSRCAAKFPEQVCVRFKDETRSFAEIEVGANQLARHLLANGVTVGETVGICMHRCPDLVISLLAVAKAGACWVLIDPDYPVDRILYVIEDSGFPVMLSEDGLMPKSIREAVNVICVDRDAGSIASMSGDPTKVEVSQQDRSYLVYTSGSTGKPKGTVISHRAIANHMSWMLGAFDFGPGDRVLQKTPCSFDAAIWEFWAPLMSGAELVLAEPGGHMDVDYLLTTIEKIGVTVLQGVPTLLEAITNYPSPATTSSLRYVFSGGEALKSDLLTQLAARFDGARVVNLYGPTEVTIDATSWICDPRDVNLEIPIGRAIDNVTTRVLDPFLQPVPAHCPGELYLGGLSLADGYHQRPGITAAAFVPDPFLPILGARLYRTGDVVYRNQGAVLSFVGRADSQLKIGGQRIEPGEVEKTLESHPSVESAIVVPKPMPERPGVLRLVGYYTIKMGARRPSENDLRDHLGQLLPPTLIPSILVPLEAVPTTPSGKLDERSLPMPDASSRIQNKVVAVELSGDAETALASIWESVLRCGKVGANDNFFDLGGDSILSLQIVARYRQQGWKLSPRDLFEYQTVSRAAARATSVGERPHGSHLPTPGALVALAPIQASFFKLLSGRGEAEMSHWNQSVLLEIAAEVSADLVSQAVEAVVEHHEVFRLEFKKDQHGDWKQAFAANAQLPKLQRVIFRYWRHPSKANA